MAYAHRVRYAYATYGTCALIHAHTRFRRSQTISTVCVRHFSSVWVCRHTARIKTRGWRRSDADCRFRQFCSNRWQRVNPRLSVTVVQAGDSCAMLQSRSRVDQPDLSVTVALRVLLLPANGKITLIIVHFVHVCLPVSIHQLVIVDCHYYYYNYV